MTATDNTRIDQAALAVLIVLQTAMLGSLYAGADPHPPQAIALFAIGPFLSASIALAVAALILGPGAGAAGRAATGAACLAALVSFGPHKWLDPGIAGIWPAVLLAEAACAALLVRVAAGIHGRREALHGRPD